MKKWEKARKVIEIMWCGRFRSDHFSVPGLEGPQVCVFILMALIDSHSGLVTWQGYMLQMVTSHASNCQEMSRNVKNCRGNMLAFSLATYEAHLKLWSLCVRFRDQGCVIARSCNPTKPCWQLEFKLPCLPVISSCLSHTFRVSNDLKPICSCL